MILREELEGLMAIVEKDLKAYYFKPPNISWGILFPLVLALSFSLDYFRLTLNYLSYCPSSLKSPR